MLCCNESKSIVFPKFFYFTECSFTKLAILNTPLIIGEEGDSFLLCVCVCVCVCVRKKEREKVQEEDLDCRIVCGKTIYGRIENEVNDGRVV